MEKSFQVNKKLNTETNKTLTNFDNIDCSEVYNKIASEFKNSRSYEWKWVSDFITRVLLEKEATEDVETNTKLRILDIGCGGGRNIKSYTNDKIEMIGLDNSSEFIRLCREDNLPVIWGNMIDIPCEEMEFDHLLSVASFHHLSTLDARLKCLCEMNRILKMNGLVLMSVWSFIQPDKTKRKFDHYGHTLVPWKRLDGKVFDRYYYIFKLDELISLFKQCGFYVCSNIWSCGNEVFTLKKIANIENH